ncbi:MAG: polyphosphate polymerase domain-containing protein [Butyrivibrio sp.]|jgi:hypothetical protein|nr:polyphosphate polymerase domain-containing protein [Butyrivibrio sp.]
MLKVFRKEIKYRIPVETYLMLEGRLGLLLERDRYGDQGEYVVRSQYYDSFCDQDLQDNLDGLMEKRKIRLRIYSPEDCSAKLEYKCKSGMDGLKYSIVISKKEALQMENHDYSFLLMHEEELATFLYVKLMQNVYRPKTIVEYHRRAYTCPASDIRITFDYDMRFATSPYGLFDSGEMYQPLGNMDMGVLEVKYNDFLIAPVREIIQQIDRLADANSKYSQARLRYM